MKFDEQNTVFQLIDRTNLETTKTNLPIDSIGSIIHLDDSDDIFIVRHIEIKIEHKTEFTRKYSDDITPSWDDVDDYYVPGHTTNKICQNTYITVELDTEHRRLSLEKLEQKKAGIQLIFWFSVTIFALLLLQSNSHPNKKIREFTSFDRFMGSVQIACFFGATVSGMALSLSSFSHNFTKLIE
ncbi:hypothetical protein H6F86_08460 [Phormidium sp. FACHB-592]|uniref:Uncharacterized protein n=1 Tax=Stenomitos frigidus AS-A4 TaxID=2933935 RepID=A0ABV0KRD4_9CYAN|nr:hypothetical protein [Phormidium sp. FACHB-592]MBD2073920.1 hypothetical protein [Phormidium sp. FACHB-592]